MHNLATLLNQSRVLRRELRHKLTNWKFEISPQGIVFRGGTGLVVGGVMGHEVWRMCADGPLSLGRREDHNKVPTEGLNRLVENWLDAGAQIANVYVSIFEGDYTPVDGLTASSYPTDATESTAYDESTRPAFTPGTVASGSVDNTASRATFTMNATKTIYGGALHTTSTKSSTTAPIMAAVRFGSSRSVIATDQIDVDYTFTASDT